MYIFRSCFYLEMNVLTPTHLMLQLSFILCLCVPRAYTCGHINTKSPQSYKKKLTFANNLAKKCQKNAASTNLGRFSTSCIDRSWVIFHPLYRPYMGDISQQKRPSDESLFLVPRAGVEPARIAPLVFETSASTDSAIWAKKREFCVTH